MAYDDEKGGRPPLFKTPEELEKMIDSYFAKCEDYYLKDKDGQMMVNTLTNEPLIKKYNKPSVVDLALYLGYASRQSIYDLEKGKNEEFSYIIKKAKSKVESWVLKYAMENELPTALGIFLLKQFGYTDKHKIDVSLKDELEKDKSMLNALVNNDETI